MPKSTDKQPMMDDKHKPNSMVYKGAKKEKGTDYKKKDYKKKMPMSSKRSY